MIAQLKRRVAQASDSTRSSPARPGLDAQSIARAESILGRSLPPLLAGVYQLVGDGGFGPGHGLLRLLARTDETESVVGLYRELLAGVPSDSAWSWPASLVPFCEWGCAIRSCVDTSSADAPVFTFDLIARTDGEPMSYALAPTHSRLCDWFSDWLAGVDIWALMFEPDPSREILGVNPFTKQPVSHVPNKLRRR